MGPGLPGGGVGVAEGAHEGTPEKQPVHGFRALQADLATVVKNRTQPRMEGAKPFEMLTHPTDLQRKAFEPLGARLTCTH